MIAPLRFSFAVTAAGDAFATFPATAGLAFSRHVAPDSVAPATPFTSGVARLFASFDSLAATIPPLLPLPEGLLAGAIHLMGFGDWLARLAGRGPAGPKTGPIAPTPPAEPPDPPSTPRPKHQWRSRWDEGATGPVSASPSFEEREGGKMIVVIVPRGRLEELTWLIEDLDADIDYWAHSKNVDRLILKFNKSGIVRVEGRLGSVGEDGRRLLMGRDINCYGIFDKVAAHIASMTQESWDEGAGQPAPSPAQVEFKASGRQLVCVVPRGRFKEVRSFLPYETAGSIDRLAATTGVDRLVLRVARGHIRVEGRIGGQGEGGRQFKMGKVVIAGSDFENLVNHAMPIGVGRYPIDLQRVEGSTVWLSGVSTDPALTLRAGEGEGPWEVFAERLVVPELRRSYGTGGVISGRIFHFREKGTDVSLIAAVGEGGFALRRFSGGRGGPVKFVSRWQGAANPPGWESVFPGVSLEKMEAGLDSNLLDWTSLRAPWRRDPEWP